MIVIIRSLILMVIMLQLPEITVASFITEHPTDGSRLMEIILERGNMFKALKRVRDNKRAPGPEVNLPDQPNRRIRIRTYGGVGGTLSDGRSYPDSPFYLALR
jgi:RNA-directed DNA polymerase